MDKLRQVEHFLGMKLDHHKLDLDEVQDIDPPRVLEHKAKEAYRILGKPVLVEDTSLTFTAMGRLPGPFIKFFVHELSMDGICKMMNAFDDRSGFADIIFGLYDGKEFRVFDGRVEGTVAANPRDGEAGIAHGWDSIFIPAGQNKTFSEMNEDEYTNYSARKKAVEKLAKYIKNTY